MSRLAMGSSGGEMAALPGEEAQSPGAATEALQVVQRTLGVTLPSDYLAFLSWSNGWEGFLGVDYVELSSTDDVLIANDSDFRQLYPGVVSIGGDGGVETFALDHRQGDTAAGVLMFDRVAGLESAIWIAATFREAMARLAVEPLRLLLEGGLSLGNGDNKISLAIDGYEFPGAHGYDGEWLIVVGSVATIGRSWAFRDPCLLASEFVGLVAWLKALAEGRDAILDRRIDFEEPAFAFAFERLDPATVRLTVELDQEAAPPRSRSLAPERVSIAFVATNAQLDQAASDLAGTATDVIERQRQRGQLI
jgi:hypothetical protein